MFTLTVEQPVPVSHVDIESDQDSISPIRTIYRNEVSSRRSLSPHIFETLRERDRMAVGEFHLPNYEIFVKFMRKRGRERDLHKI